MKRSSTSRVRIWRRDLDVPVRMPSGHCYRSRAVLFDQIGWGPHRCWWCRGEIDWAPKGTVGALEADHLDGDVSNDEADNLVPACRRCNQCRSQGLLWFVLRNSKRANWPEIARWGPTKTEFPCGHLFVARNIYSTRSGEHTCLTCRRRLARDAWRAKNKSGREAHSATAPIAKTTPRIRTTQEEDRSPTTTRGGSMTNQRTGGSMTNQLEGR